MPRARRSSTDATAGRRTRAGWFAPASFALAAVGLGAAVQVDYGQYHPLALGWLTLALVACAAGVLRMRRTVSALPEKHLRLSPDVVILSAGLALQFAMLLSRSPGVAEMDARVNLPGFRAGLVAAAALAAVAAFGPHRLRRVALVLMLTAHFGLGLWLLRSSPPPAVDVCIFQHNACDALLEGRNPYTITFPDISPKGRNLYGPGLSDAGRLQFGYPYPPLSLLLALPGHLLGDFRYSQLAAMTLAGALVAACRPGPRATLAAALLLFTPRGFFVLQAGWTEPFVALALALTIFLACRRERRIGSGHTSASWPLAIAAGLLLVTKQYLLLAAPLAALLLPLATWRERRRFFLLACGTALLVTLPLALWDLQAFTHSAALLQFRQPFRNDALSYLVPLARATGGPPSPLISFALATGTLALCLWKSPRTPSGFAAAVAVTFLVFFAFSKQAFCNYYHLVIAALCCAIASAPEWVHRGDAEDAEEASSPESTATPRHSLRLCGE